MRTAKQIIQSILDKFKEKKMNVYIAMQIGSEIYCPTIGNIIPHCNFVHISPIYNQKVSLRFIEKKFFKTGSGVMEVEDRVITTYSSMTKKDKETIDKFLMSLEAKGKTFYQCFNYNTLG